jgi:hypothetical protein
MDAREIAANLVGRDGQRQVRVPVAGALSLPDADLPVDPYTLGCWLGDGSVGTGRISKPDDEMFRLITESSGLGVGRSTSSDDKCPTRTIYGLVGLLRDAGVLHHKHIPDAYQRAGQNQREALLQGLMDSDGTAAPTRKQVSFSSTSKELAFQVEELVAGLGQRPVTVQVEGTGFGKAVTSWRVQWRPTNRLNPFRMSRKADRTHVDEKSSRSGRRVVVSAEPTIIVATQCLMVDSPDHTYLCDRKMIPTHNTVGDDDEWESGSITVGGQGTGRAPLSYQAQIQWQMGILGLRKGWLGCYVSNQARDFYVVEVDFDIEWFREMTDAAERFWAANILSDEPPMHDLRHPKTEEMLKQLNPVVVRPSVDLPEEAEEWLVEYQRAKAEADRATRNLDAVKNFFRLWTADAGAGYLGDRKVVSYPVVNSSRIDVEALKRDFPEIAEKVTVRSTHRRLTITVPKELKSAT